MELKEIEQLFLDILAEPYTVAVDVGAHIGCYIETMIKNKNIVYAYEPVPKLYKKLHSEFSSQGDVFVKNLAVSDYIGKTLLHIPIVNGQMKYGWASCCQDFDNEYPTEVISVDTTTLDNEKIENIGLIKIDVEGFEIEVIKGATQILNHYKPNLIIEMEERHRINTIKMTSEYLSNIGYKGFYIDILNNTVKSFDVLCVKNMQRDFLNGKYPIYVNNFIFVAKERYDDTVNEIKKKHKLIRMWTRMRSEAK